MYVVDSNVFIGAFNPRDAYHKEASSIILSIDKGEVGESLITDGEKNALYF
ncbi:MAG: hypothetical protein AOA65_2061 [Candidatus Bathyarchaeota archaeon BA1]|nr:MAG: hypothetical protein AOA65_2061 [Candidatus Bathyarchaeota archaeon BA1]